MRIYSGCKQQRQPPKQSTHTHNKHTDTFHKLPTIRQHPDEEWIKKSTQNTRAATVPLHGVDTVDNIVEQNTTEHTIMTTVPLHWVSTIMATAPLHWVDTIDNIIEQNTI